MSNIIDFIKSQSIIVIVIIGLLLFFVYSMFSVLINKLNNAKYGKTTIFAWFPIINVFLLGKLVVFWLFGIILLLGLLFGVVISVDIKGLEIIHNLIPQQYVLIYLLAYITIILFLVIMGKIKINRIHSSGLGKDEMSTFIAKDYEEEAKKPKLVAETPTTNTSVEEPIKDFYHNIQSDNSNNSNNENPK